MRLQCEINDVKILDLQVTNHNI